MYNIFICFLVESFIEKIPLSFSASDICSFSQQVEPGKLFPPVHSLCAKLSYPLLAVASHWNEEYYNSYKFFSFNSLLESE